MTTPTERLFAAMAERGPAAVDVVTRAYALSAVIHHGRFRRNGETALAHCVAVAAIVADLGGDTDAVAVALLHEAASTGRCPPDVVRAELGCGVGDLLERFRAIDDTTDLRGIDRRALTIRVVSRLRNMRTIAFLEKATQQRKARHTLRLVAPAARDSGHERMAAELERLAAETLRRHRAASVPEGRVADDAAVRAARGVLRTAGRLLPATCRGRWVAEWEAEMHALAGPRDRVRFVLDLLRGLPAMAARARTTPVKELP